MATATVIDVVAVMIVPGSGLVEGQAEAEGCTGSSSRPASTGASRWSMCLAMIRPARAPAALRLDLDPPISNAVRAQRPTHLVSPAIAAAAAVAGQVLWMLRHRLDREPAADAD